MNSDIFFMKKALDLARKAEEKGEVPVGALLVAADNTIICEASNSSISDCDPSAHAEINALRLAGKSLENYRLPGTVLYVTLEPCVMCFGALIHARVGRIVYACDDPKSGALTQFKLANLPGFNHKIEIVSGVLRLECSEMLKKFFLKKRLEKR